MKTNQLLAALAVCTAALCPALLQAQTTPAKAPAASPPTAYEKWAKQVKNPTDWLTWSADIRVRNENYDNIATLADNVLRHEQDVIRYRGRVWATATPWTNIALNVRLSAEPRGWMRPSFVGAYLGQSGMEWRYGIFDNLNLKLSNVADLPLTITAGRQDVMMGDFYDWWLTADGTPGDGSWAFFLDGIRLTYDVADIKTKFDLMYIYHQARPDATFPTLGRSGPDGGNPSGYNLVEQNEQGVMFYASNKSIQNMQIDGYFFYKRDNKEFGNGDSADIYTIGGKITGTPAEHWQYSVEGGYQFGSKQDATVGAAYVNSAADWRDISAYGGKAKLTYLFKDKRNNQVGLQAEYLSGDDPDTKDTDEMFDLLWGRWPRWSELYIYSYINETSGKIAQVNNIVRFGPSWTIAPIKGMTFSTVYNAMFAPESIPTRCTAAGGPRFSRTDDFRGHYIQAILKYQFNKQLLGHVWGEFIWQGDYYAQRDLLRFVRAELLYTF